MLRRDRLRSQLGQTATELLGVLLLVAVIGGFLVQSQWGGKLGQDIKEQICKIAGTTCDGSKGDYEAGIPPLSECVRDSGKRGINGSVKILRFELGAGVEGTKEIRADGSVRISIKGNAKAGVDFSKPGAEFEGGGQEGDTGKLSIKANLNGAATYAWDFKNEDDANEFMGNVEKKVKAIADITPNFPGSDDDADIDLPDPTLKTYEGGVEVSGAGSTGSAKLDGSLGAGVGVTYNQDNGDKTVFFELKGQGNASAKSPNNPLAGGLGGSGRIAVTYDKDGNEKAVRFVGTVDVTGGFKLDQDKLKSGDLTDVAAAASKDKLEGGAEGGGRLVLDANLALGSKHPENQAAWDAFKSGLNPLNGQPITDGAGQLLDRFNKDSVFNAKVYALTKSKTGGGFDAGVFGAEGYYTEEDAKILGAWYRDKVNGGLKSWDECVKGLAD